MNVWQIAYPRPRSPIQMLNFHLGYKSLHFRFMTRSETPLTLPVRQSLGEGGRKPVQAWRVPHPPRRGVFLLGTQPQVHRGFHQVWQEVVETVLATVEEVLAAATVPTEDFDMFVTGESPPGRCEHDLVESPGVAVERKGGGCWPAWRRSWRLRPRTRGGGLSDVCQRRRVYRIVWQLPL